MDEIDVQVFARVKLTEDGRVELHLTDLVDAAEFVVLPGASEDDDINREEIAVEVDRLVHRNGGFDLVVVNANNRGHYYTDAAVLHRDV